ncbi:MAG: hypothetical protein ACK5XN_16420 [Bacteroidota bacterium]|jgi:hypothetical protein
MDFRLLQFIPHRVLKKAKSAKIYFINGFGVSVISGTMFRSNGKPIDDENATFEVAILHQKRLCYDTPIVIDGEPVNTSDVLGHLTARQVSQVMEQVLQYNRISHAFEKEL